MGHRFHHRAGASHSCWSAAWSCPGSSRLINDEIGVRRKGPPGRLAATLALLGVVAVWGVRDYEHRRAINALEARALRWRRSGAGFRLSLLAESVSLVWRGRDPELLRDHAGGFFVPEADPEGRCEIRQKPEETPVTLAAKRSDLGRVYLDWAKYPVVETEEIGVGLHRSIFAIFAIDYPDQTRRGLLGAA